MDPLNRLLLQLPGLGPFYARNAATIKRDACLLLHRLGKLRPLTFVQWLATYACNLSCPFCEASAGKAGPDELTTAEVRALIEDVAGLGARRLVVSGGEPLVRPDVVELMGYARKRGLAVGLVSNGSLVEKRWEELGRLDYYLYFTSLDGPAAVHDAIRGEGSFERTVNGLRRFAGVSTPTRIVNTVVQPATLETLPELRDVVRDSGATSWHLTPASKVGRAAETDRYSLSGAQLRELVAFVRAESDWVDLGESHAYLGRFDGRPAGKPFFCGAGLTRCAIMPDGTVLGCQQVYDSSFAEGNIRERPFSEIWRHGFARFRRPATPGFCAGCEHLAACQGGCWAEMTLRGSCLKPVWEESRPGGAEDEVRER